MPAAVEAAFPVEGETLERRTTSTRGVLTLHRANHKIATLVTVGPA